MIIKLICFINWSIKAVDSFKEEMCFLNFVNKFHYKAYLAYINRCAVSKDKLPYFYHILRITGIYNITNKK